MWTFITMSDISLETEGDALIHQVLLVNAVDMLDVCSRACFHFSLSNTLNLILPSPTFLNRYIPAKNIAIAIRNQLSSLI